MVKMKRLRMASIFVVLGGIFFLSSSASGDHHGAESEGATVGAALQVVIDGTHRSDENRARDKDRHPGETLSWLGLKSDMTVVEVSPGRGWYTEIIGPYLKDEGKLYLAGPDLESDRDYAKTQIKLMDERLRQKDIYGAATVTELAPPAKINIAPEGTADMILTFRNTHNWMRAGTSDLVYAAMFKALKPGGVLGVVQHRANADSAKDSKAPSGYVHESTVIATAEQAGFKLVAQSEINANSKDTKDYSGGVWSLPPVLGQGDEEKEKYLAIGESDRMTLKFKKPVE